MLKKRISMIKMQREPLPTRLLKIGDLHLGKKKTDRNPRVNREKVQKSQNSKMR